MKIYNYCDFIKILGVTKKIENHALKNPAGKKIVATYITK
jgi:hypothetical protein